MSFPKRTRRQMIEALKFEEERFLTILWPKLSGEFKSIQVNIFNTFFSWIIYQGIIVNINSLFKKYRVPLIPYFNILKTYANCQFFLVIIS